MTTPFIGAAARESYDAPVLVTYGTIASLTQGPHLPIGGGLINALQNLHLGHGGGLGGGIGHGIGGGIGGGRIHRIHRS